MQATVGAAGPAAAVPKGAAAVAVVRAQIHQILTSPVSTTKVDDAAAELVDARMIGPVLLSVVGLICPNIM